MRVYRDLKEKHTFLEMCKTPELACEVTLQPLDVLGVDAAIIFADILLPLEPMGTGLEFSAGDGPVIPRPVRDRKAVEKLLPVNAEEQLGFVADAIRLVRKEINIPLVGFAGAPFTLCSYMVEGGKSREFKTTKLMMYEATDVWELLMDKVCTMLVDYLKMQVSAGAQALQIFDSWVGCLSPSDYEKYILPYSRRVFEDLKDVGVPVINFSTGTSTMLGLVQKAGGDVLSFDWRIQMDSARTLLGKEQPVQGNLDPLLLLAGSDRLESRILTILEAFSGRPHVFNLGHGIDRRTPIAHVRRALATVRDWQRGA